MKRYAVLGIIVALVVSIAAIGCSDGGSSGPTPQPKTATAQPTTGPTSAPTDTPNQAATATSLDFTVEYVIEGQGTFTYRYRARNIGTSSLDFRFDATLEQMNAAYILKGSTRQGWIYTGDQWFEFTTMYHDFDEFWDSFYASFERYRNYLSEEWTGVQGWIYTIPGVGTVTYTNIDINPSLPESIFQPD